MSSDYVWVVGFDASTGNGDAVHPLPQEQRAVSREPLRLRGVFRADDDERGVGELADRGGSK